MIKTFEFLIQTGVDQLELIGDAEKKATICAELAKAIAISGVLRPESEIVEETEAPAEETTKTSKKAGKKSSKKDSLKAAASKAPVEPIEVPEEEPVVPAEPAAPVEEVAPEAPATAEVEIVAEWTDEMVEVKSVQLGTLNAYVEAWGEEYVYSDCLKAFTEGAMEGAENVLPTNIDGFVIYLEELAKQFAEQ